MRASRTCLIPLKSLTKTISTRKIIAKEAVRFHSKDSAALLDITVACAQRVFVITAAPNADYRKLILSCTSVATCATLITNNLYKNETTMINEERELLVNEITDFLLKTEPEMIAFKQKERDLAV